MNRTKRVKWELKADNNSSKKNISQSHVLQLVVIRVGINKQLHFLTKKKWNFLWTQNDLSQKITVLCM